MAASIAHSDRSAALRRFLDALAEMLHAAAGAEQATRASLDDFARRVSAIDVTATALPAPGRIDVCRFWDDALRGGSGPVVAPLTVLGPSLSWTQNPNYRRQPPDPAFLDNYGDAVIVGPADGPPGLAGAPDVALGVLLLGPRTHYPLHAHPAVEVYVTLSPDGEWWRDQGPWRRVPAGTTIHHPSGMLHATRAGEAPLLAVYVWRGALATHATLCAI